VRILVLNQYFHPDRSATAQLLTELCEDLSRRHELHVVSGRPSYNQRLSVRRAENVAAELVRDGVPRNVISIHGYGETHLLVPTGPGVREPQNRRVEIIIR